MTMHFRTIYCAILLFCLIDGGWTGVACGGQTTGAEEEAAALQHLYQTFQKQLAENPFGQPLHLVSREEGRHVSAVLAAPLAYPFDTFVAAFAMADNWCQIMMLHLNVKFCSAQNQGEQDRLTVFVGRKHQQPLEAAHRSEYVYELMRATPDYFQAFVSAEQGPLGTRNYRIRLEAVPLDETRTFIRFAYAYDFGLLARAAKSLYFSTAGREKVGFSMVDNGADSEPEYIGGVRGAVERNIMRYYLAVTAYLDSLALPAAQQLNVRLETWFARTERYARQLHELEKEDYLEMKRMEFQRVAE